MINRATKSCRFLEVVGNQRARLCGRRARRLQSLLSASPSGSTKLLLKHAQPATAATCVLVRTHVSPPSLCSSRNEWISHTHTHTQHRRWCFYKVPVRGFASFVLSPGSSGPTLLVLSGSVHQALARGGMFLRLAEPVLRVLWGLSEDQLAHWCRSSSEPALLGLLSGVSTLRPFAPPASCSSINVVKTSPCVCRKTKRSKETVFIVNWVLGRKVEVPLSRYRVGAVRCCQTLFGATAKELF